MDTNRNDQHLTGKEGEEFDLQLAASWTKNHRDKHPEQAISHFFGREILEKILAQPGCMGLRFYHSYNDNEERHLIVVGATADGNDQLDTAAPETSSGSPMAAAMMQANIVGQQALPCPGPPGCPQNALSGS